MLAADPCLKPGGIAAIGVNEGGTEALVVLVEIDQRTARSLDLGRLGRAVNAAVTKASGFTPRRSCRSPRARCRARPAASCSGA